jgi:hypothetical protein
MNDPRILTSPKAIIAFEIVQWLDQLVGPIEAQRFMHKRNDQLADSIVGALRADRLDDVRRFIRGIAMQLGIFEEPWLPPNRPKSVAKIGRGMAGLTKSKPAPKPEEKPLREGRTRGKPKEPMITDFV